MTLHRNPEHQTNYQRLQQILSEKKFVYLNKVYSINFPATNKANQKDHIRPKDHTQWLVGNNATGGATIMSTDATIASTWKPPVTEKIKEGKEPVPVKVVVPKRKRPPTKPTPVSKRPAKELMVRVVIKKAAPKPLKKKK